MITSKQLDVMMAYLHYRKNGEISKCLELMSDNIVIISEKDGTVKGKKEVEKYLEKNKFQGDWSLPYWSTEDKSIRIDGKVKLYMLPFNVKILAKFDNNDKINNVWIGRR